MNAKKMLFALIAGFIAMFLLSGLWYTLIMADFYEANSPSTAFAEPKMQFIVLGYFILALILAYIYPLGYKGGSPVIEGLKFGVVMGLLWILPIGVVLFGVMESSGILLVVDAIWHVVEQGIGGIVIGLVYGSQIPSVKSAS
ncbi:MAG: hypothetical protein KAT05_11600 [Spirochaetes bacterium]|nr:hypothetical protein [Spirochaetota bacterium]